MSEIQTSATNSESITTTDPPIVSSPNPHTAPSSVGLQHADGLGLSEALKAAREAATAKSEIATLQRDKAAAEHKAAARSQAAELQALQQQAEALQQQLSAAKQAAKVQAAKAALPGLRDPEDHLQLVVGMVELGEGGQLTADSASRLSDWKASKAYLFDSSGVGNMPQAGAPHREAPQWSEEDQKILRFNRVGNFRDHDFYKTIEEFIGFGKQPGSTGGF